jgi:uncharacterized delta-60 repeat protein
MWQKCLGGSRNDSAYSIQQTSDGGYIVAGSTNSNNGGVAGNHGGWADAWVVKLNASGDIMWQKCLGGSYEDSVYSIQQTSDGGYIAAGSTNSNNGDVIGNHGRYDAWVVKLNALGGIVWQKCLGGSNEDSAYSIQQTSDGGYIVAGHTYSTDGNVAGNHGENNAWVIKLNASGDIMGQKCLGGSRNDSAFSIQQTNDGGYIVAGDTNSTDGDTAGNHGGKYDAWVIKLNASGGIVWQKCLGGSDEDSAYSIQQTSDGGYIVAGNTHSTDGDVIGNHGRYDAWIVKLNTAGSIVWQKCLGGSYVDKANSVQQTSDEGYIIAGNTRSTDGDVIGNHGRYDAWIVKLNIAGSIVWQKCLGSSYGDKVNSIQQTSDGGYIAAGNTNSNDGDVAEHHEGGTDAWVAKLNVSGDIVWQKCLGGSRNDSAFSIQQTSDGGYIVAGETNSTDGDVTKNYGEYDAWVIKLNASGDIVWQKCLGGSDEDSAYSIQQTSDGGYIVAGSTNSNNGGVAGNHGGWADAWVVKLNASGDIVWQKCLGGSYGDKANSIRQTSGGGYIVAGNTRSNDGDAAGNHGKYDAWVVRLNASGDIVWQKCLGGSGWDSANSIQQTSDRGYIVAGYTFSTDGDAAGNHGESDAWVVKLNALGGIVWQKCLGGSEGDEANSVQQTSDGGYIVAGQTKSTDGDAAGNHGKYDAWVVRLNASGGIVWQKCLGGSDEDAASSIQQTSEGEYIAAGQTKSTDGDAAGNHGAEDAWIVKLNP